MQKKSFSFPRQILLPLTIGTLSVVLAFWGMQQEKLNTHKQLQNTLEVKSEQLTNRIQQRATNIVLLIREISDADFLDSNPDVEIWTQRMKNLKLTSILPEVKVVGFWYYDSNSNSFSEKFILKNTFNTPSSFEKIFKESNTENIILNSKKSENSRLHDVRFIDYLQGDLEHAIAYYPVYKETENNESENNILLGFVYAFINMDETFAITRAHHQDVNFSIIRSTSTNGMRSLHVANDNLSYSPIFRYKTVLSVESETWVINFYSEPEFEKLLNEYEEWKIMFLGVVIGVLLFFVTYLVASSRERAVRLAEKMTISLKKSESNFRMAFDNTTFGMALIDIESHKFIKVNEAFCNITGYTENEATNLEYEKIFGLTEDDYKVMQEFLNNKRTSFSGNFHDWMPQRGKRIWLHYGVSLARDINEKPTHFVLSLEDVTTEIEAQEKIKREQKRLRLAVDSFKIAVWDWDPIKDNANWDPLMDSFLGLTAEQTKSRSMQSILDVLHPDDKSSFEEICNSASKKGKNFEVTYRVIHPDGAVRIINSKGIATHGTKKSDLKYFGISFDVTEEKALEQLKSNFVSIASHQLRTPLTAIRWFLQMVTDNADKDPLSKKQTTLLNKVDNSAQRMLALVNDLLSVSRLNTGRIEMIPVKLSIREMTEKVIEDVTVSLKEKKQKVVIKTRLKKTDVVADKTMTEQVIQNLVTNANKYGEENSNIIVNITGTKSHIQFSINNKGTPIEEEDKGKLFQQFFRSKSASISKADGSGLGLYISKAIVERSGGEIWCDSSKAKGTTCSFTLPRK